MTKPQKLLCFSNWGQVRSQMPQPRKQWCGLGKQWRGSFGKRNVKLANHIKVGGKCLKNWTGPTENSAYFSMSKRKPPPLSTPFKTSQNHHKQAATGC